MQKRKRKNRKKTILLTGGHARSTAFAVIQEIRERKKGWDLCFIGSKNALVGKKIPTLEAEVFPKLGVKFYPLYTGRVQRRFTLWTIPSLLKIPIGFLHSLTLLLKIKPDLILSFGGFSAFPVVVMAWIMRIPVLIHEQTNATGRANKYSSFFATKIALSRESSKKYFSWGKTVLTGNPVSMGISKIKPKKKINSTPNILFTGGQTGAVAINDTIEEILPELLGKFKIVHQTGAYQHHKFSKIRRRLPVRLKDNYRVYSVISPKDWYKHVRHADIIVSRSGANAVSEIMVTKRPSILIPLPIAYLNEQEKNALYARKFGIAEVLDQSSLTPQALLKEIKKTTQNWYEIVNKTKDKKSPDLDASKNLVDLIVKLLD